MPGAFKASLARRGADGVRMLFQHDAHQPIGVWRELREDARGLYAKGQLTLDVGKAREVLSLMRAGALNGLSIGFKAKTFRRDPKTRVRRLFEVDLWGNFRRHVSDATGCARGPCEGRPIPHICADGKRV